MNQDLTELMDCIEEEIYAQVNDIMLMYITEFKQHGYGIALRKKEFALKSIRTTDYTRNIICKYALINPCIDLDNPFVKTLITNYLWFRRDQAVAVINSIRDKKEVLDYYADTSGKRAYLFSAIESMQDLLSDESIEGNLLLLEHMHHAILQYSSRFSHERDNYLSDLACRFNSARTNTALRRAIHSKLIKYHVTLDTLNTTYEKDKYREITATVIKSIYPKYPLHDEALLIYDCLRTLGQKSLKKDSKEIHQLLFNNPSTRSDINVITEIYDYKKIPNTQELMLYIEVFCNTVANEGRLSASHTEQAVLDMY